MNIYNGLFESHSRTQLDLAIISLVLLVELTANYRKNIFFY